MYRKCCVPKCDSIRQDVKFHQFPKKEEMKRQWLRCINRDVLGETKNMFVCHNHFEKRFVKVTNRLRMGAYPTLFSDLEIFLGKPNLSSFPPRTDTFSENTYSRNGHIDHSYAQPYEQITNRVAQEDISDTKLLHSIEDQLSPVASESSTHEFVSDTNPLHSIENQLSPVASANSRHEFVSDTNPLHSIEDQLPSVASANSTHEFVSDTNPLHSIEDQLSPVAFTSSTHEFVSDTNLLHSTEDQLSPVAFTSSTHEFLFDTNLLHSIKDQLPPASTSSTHEFVSGTCILPIEDKLATVAPTTTSLKISSGSVCKPPRKLVRRRLVNNVKSLTPSCQLLYKEYKRVLQNNHNLRLKRAQVSSKNKYFEKATKNMNPLARQFLLMQMKLATKKKMGRRFTTEEKLIALEIYKQGPKTYKFLQKIFILPSKTTMKKMLSITGINPQID